ncbi:UNVERIFIED_CONTAM: hypothetical protein PYX00_010793 [Menopon gallinae]|uniref:Uncharacterized protein n=1 Tax=Menopon gallinae TaxID=328185 RepID=A0AAW2HGZ6_9NEOP
MSPTCSETDATSVKESQHCDTGSWLTGLQTPDPLKQKKKTFRGPTKRITTLAVSDLRSGARKVDEEETRTGRVGRDTSRIARVILFNEECGNGGGGTGRMPHRIIRFTHRCGTTNRAGARGLLQRQDGEIRT